MDVSEAVRSKASLTLELPPSCVQFCPAHPEYFVVGTYNLQREEQAESPADDASEQNKKPQSRNGSLVVFKIVGDELIQVQTLLQPSAILDLRFHPDPLLGDVFAVVSSTGSIAVFRFDPAKDPPTPLQHLATSRCEDLEEDVLFLQCNWHPGAQKLIAVTTSLGESRLLRLDGEWRIQDSFNMNVDNSLEAWCIAFAPESKAPIGVAKQTSVYCGGDDSLLRYTSCLWDAAKEDDALTTDFEPLTIKGQHDAGVTAILPLEIFTPGSERLVLTGSYDDHLRLFSIQDLHESYGLKRVKLLSEKNLDGGVWRLDLMSAAQKGSGGGGGGWEIRVLASCMHAGARVVDLTSDDGESWSSTVVARFEEHKSMNYGSDFKRGGDGDRVQCVSTSFYDKLLCLWEFNPPS